MVIGDQINLAMAVATGLSATATMAMTIITLFILRANRATIKAMEQQIVAASRPYIQITPKTRVMTTEIELHIKNVGNSPAEKLRLTLDKDFQFNATPGDQHNLRKYSAFSRDILMLPPGAELRFFLGVGHTIFRNQGLCPIEFSIRANYNFQDKPICEVTAIDLTPFDKSVQPVDAVAERLDTLITEIRATREQLCKES